VNGKAYLFTARSGTGKTTHAKLWLKKIKNSYVLNGDKPLIKIQKDGIILCGTLWCGKEGFGVNEILPLKAICVLERDTVNHIERITASEALPILYQQSHHCDGVEDMERTLSLLEWLTQNVEFYRMGCNMEDEAALVSYGAMSG
jgi:ABC-type multidrug transport system ATPase subunit